MQLQHSPPAKNISSLTEWKFGQRTTNGRSSTLQKRRWPGSRSGEAEDEEGEESVEEEESEEIEVAASLAGAPKASESLNLAHSNQPLVSQAEPNFLNMMEKMTQFMGQLTQAVSQGILQKPQHTRSINEGTSFL
ncbi:hypothetical protein O181_078782 [Austropuccinia psidii MF-1]|uniref:Uncharacterized protein n=1 Tax=Austropuccinia psidii MF-1 TaxID=1389203 RepID=A0A9Q3IFW8_9BASI|nr:hypothetical protein [Austropuccinia psidii MF-1]